MQMSEFEIVASFREAANKNKQVGVLADLNACKPEVIMEILARHGAISGVTKQSIVKKKEHETPKKNTDKLKRAESIKWTPELDAEVSRLAGEGLKIVEIAERLGINKQAIYDRRSALSRAVKLSLESGSPKVKIAKTKVEKALTVKKENTERCEASERCKASFATFTVFEKIVDLLGSSGWDVSCCNIDFLGKTVNIVANLQ